MSTTHHQAELAKGPPRRRTGPKRRRYRVVVDGYGVKVNLTEATEHAAIPSEIDGVPVVVEIIGIISAD